MKQLKTTMYVCKDCAKAHYLPMDPSIDNPAEGEPTWSLDHECALCGDPHEGMVPIDPLWIAVDSRRLAMSLIINLAKLMNITISLEGCYQPDPDPPRASAAPAVDPKHPGLRPGEKVDTMQTVQKPGEKARTIKRWKPARTR